MAHDEKLILLVIAAFAGGAGLTAVLRRVAIHRGITDHPSEIKRHDAATPYLGGVAIALCVVAGSSFLPGWRAEALVIVAAALLVACVGLIDDIRTLGPLPRVVVEILAASIVFAAGARVNLGGDVVDYVLTVTWIVVLTNAFNLLDNMDGCAGLIATATATALAVAALLEGQVLVGGLAVVVAGACAGFFVHNWHPVRPAKIFMGDAGSLFLGFMLSTIALKLRFPSSRLDGVVAVILLAAPALFDTTLVVISRVRADRPILSGGTDHTSHRLRMLGMAKPLVPVALAGATAFCGALGILVGRGFVPAGAVLGTLVPAGAVLLWASLRLPVYALEGDSERRSLVTSVTGPGPVPALSAEAL
jgi:UDP-GlcNAc:undecaprenyl-phosphate GlcNAc-1-phosphate transferase